MMNNKQALSEMVAYTLLIVLAVSMSVIVYAYLKAYILKPEVKCNSEISLMIEDYSCLDKQLNLTVRNNGKFNVEGFMIRIGRTIGEPAVYPIEFIRGDGGQVRVIPSFNVSETKIFVFDYSKFSGIASIELEPFIIRDKKLIFCQDAVISLDVRGC